MGIALHSAGADEWTSVDAGFAAPPAEFRLSHYSAHDGASLPVQQMAAAGIGGVQLFMQRDGYLQSEQAWDNVSNNIAEVKGAGAPADPATAPAGDGIANLLKYAFNLDPLRHEGTGQYPGEFRGLPYLEGVSGDFLQLIYYRDPAKTGIRVVPVWKTQLSEASGWTEVFDRQMLGSQDGIEEWRARLPLDGVQGFIRIQVGSEMRSEAEKGASRPQDRRAAGKPHLAS